jgi:hypothetical protein
VSKKYSELDVINGAVDDIMAGRPIDDAIGEIGTAVDAALAKHREKDEQLRKLLSYCKGMSDGNESGDAREAYDDVADKLAAILDGEQ